MTFKILFIEPPKDYWFLMGEYLPPPMGLLALAAFVERDLEDVEVDVIDCQAESLGWSALEKRIYSLSPDVVASSGFTCNAYGCARTAEIAKTVDPGIITIVGGQHFSFTSEESLSSFPEIDYVIRGEGERTLVELIMAVRDGGDLTDIRGLSFRAHNKNVHNPPRPLIEDLDSLPYPAYHLVEKNLHRYHMKVMAGKERFLILEGARGCWHRCSFCTQWRHWSGTWRTKTAKRIANEMVHLRDNFGAGFLWLADDNFELGLRGEELARALADRGYGDSTTWFFQSRMDDIVQHPDVVSHLHEVGNSWQLLGVENNSPEVLSEFNKEEGVEDAAKAVKVLKDHGILAQAMMVIGSRRDTSVTIRGLRNFSIRLDADLTIFTVLTPFPGTNIHAVAKERGWIEDTNYAHYDMTHAIMPTETLSRTELQQELLDCYRAFYGSPTSIVRGLFSHNELKKRSYRHLAGKRVLHSLRQLV
jgi:anaerobic magnesium-protoporphyrin IX monomethyl ester cyclase